MKRWALVFVFLGPLFFASSSLAQTYQGEQSEIERLRQKAVRVATTLKKSKNPVMDTHLSRLLESNTQLLPQSDIATSSIRVVLHIKDNAAQRVAERLLALGATVETMGKRRIQVTLKKGLLGQVAKWDGVSYISEPIRLSGKSVISQAVSASGADILQESAITGKGVKVGIIDLGFYGYSLLEGSELPEELVTKNFRHDICGFSYCPSQAHGTAVAEIIHDMAPDAKLYLVAVSTTEEFLKAVDWLKDIGVDIVSCSLGYWLCGPMDGKGWCSKKAGSMRSAGILPVFAAGNSAKNHWEGENLDEDGDTLVDIPSTTGAVSFSAQTYDQVTVAVNWDDWGDNPEDASPDQDIDLLVLSPLPFSDTVEDVASSVNPQTGETGQMPIESVTFQTEPGRTYYIFLVNDNTNRLVNVHMFVEGSYIDEINPSMPQQSILQPADSPLVMAVGAADLSGHPLDFSSRGPTWDGRVKPDISGFSGIDTFSEPDFSGTSAAAPTVAGAAALIKDAKPNWGPDQIQAALELLARDIYTVGQDDVTGCGLLDVSRVADLSENYQTGFWWNPQKDGSGFSLERKDGSDFLAIYTYNRSGPESKPVWLTASGPAASSMLGPFALMKWHGWPVGGPVQEFYSQSVGEVTFLFLNDQRALMYVRNPQNNRMNRQELQRFIFASGQGKADSRNGWWWDENKPGNGIFMDFQSNLLFAAWYHYDENGEPRWWTFSADIADTLTGNVTAQILQWQGGPCLTCGQIKPFPATVGSVNLLFENGMPRRLDWLDINGHSGSYYLSRFPF